MIKLMKLADKSRLSARISSAASKNKTPSAQGQSSPIAPSPIPAPNQALIVESEISPTTANPKSMDNNPFIDSDRFNGRLTRQQIGRIIKPL